MKTENIISSGAVLTVEEITDSERFERLGPEWDSLLERTGNPTLYLTHEWLFTWWRCCKSDKMKLLILLVSDETGLRGIAPLMEVRTNVLGIPVTKIEFLTTTRHAYSPHNYSGSLDIIAAPPAEDVVRAVVDYLLKNQDRWQFCRLHPVPHTSVTVSVLTDEFRKRELPFSRQTAFTNFQIAVDKPWDEYSAGRSHEFRKKYRGLEKKARRYGDPVLREYSGQNIGKGFEQLLEIEARSWKQTHGVPIHAVEYHDFYKYFAEVAGTRGWLRLWILELNGVPVAYDYSVVYANRLESLKTSYNDVYRDCSPGILLSWRTFEQAFRNGVQSINLLWGDSWSKRQWTTDTVLHDELFLFNSTRLSGVCYFLTHQLLLYRLTRSIINRYGYLLRRLGFGRS